MEKTFYIVFLLVSLLLFTFVNEFVFISQIIFFMVFTTSFISYVKDENRGLLSLTYYFFVFVIIYIPSLFQVYFSEYPWREHFYEPFTIVMAYSMMSIFQCCFELGRKKVVAQRNSLMLKGDFLRDFIRSNLTFLVVFTSLLILFTGFNKFLLVKYTDQVEIIDPMVNVARSFTIVALCLVIISIKNRLFNKKLTVLFSCSILVILSICFFPAALTRFQLFAVLISIFCLLFDVTKTKSKVIVFSSGLVMFIIIFPILKSVLASQGVGLIDLADYMKKSDLDSFMQILNTLIYVDINGFNYGYGWLGLVFFFVPRSIWLSKPTHTGELVSTALNYDYFNVSSPLFAELYFGFGIVGVMVGGYLFSRFFSRIEYFFKNNYINRANNDVSYSPLFVLYALLASYSIILLRGPLNAVFPIVGFSFFYVLASYLYIRIKCGKECQS